MTDKTTPAVDEPAEATVVFKVSELNTIMQTLDEIPHKYSRNLIDFVNKIAAEQLGQKQ
jgi:hypothetical protein